MLASYITIFLVIIQLFVILYLLVVKKLEEVFKSGVVISTLQELLGHFSRSDAGGENGVLNLWEKRVVVESEVIGSELPEPTWGAIGHVDVNVHATRAKQRTVKLLLVVRGEHYDPLVSTTWP